MKILLLTWSRETFQEINTVVGGPDGPANPPNPDGIVELGVVEGVELHVALLGAEPPTASELKQAIDRLQPWMLIAVGPVELVDPDRVQPGDVVLADAIASPASAAAGTPTIAPIRPRNKLRKFARKWRPGLLSEGMLSTGPTSASPSAYNLIGSLPPAAAPVAGALHDLQQLDWLVVAEVPPTGPAAAGPAESSAVRLVVEALREQILLPVSPSLLVTLLEKQRKDRDLAYLPEFKNLDLANASLRLAAAIFEGFVAHLPIVFPADLRQLVQRLQGQVEDAAFSLDIARQAITFRERNSGFTFVRELRFAEEQVDEQAEQEEAPALPDRPSEPVQPALAVGDPGEQSHRPEVDGLPPGQQADQRDPAFASPAVTSAPAVDPSLPAPLKGDQLPDGPSRGDLEPQAAPEQPGERSPVVLVIGMRDATGSPSDKPLVQGTGFVVGWEEGQAFVVTAGHVFRDVQEKRARLLVNGLPAEPYATAPLYGQRTYSPDLIVLVVPGLPYCPPLHLSGEHLGQSQPARTRGYPEVNSGPPLPYGERAFELTAGKEEPKRDLQGSLRATELRLSSTEELKAGSSGSPIFAPSLIDDGPNAAEPSAEYDYTLPVVGVLVRTVTNPARHPGAVYSVEAALISDLRLLRTKDDQPLKLEQILRDDDPDLRARRVALQRVTDAIERRMSHSPGLKPSPPRIIGLHRLLDSSKRPGSPNVLQFLQHYEASAANYWYFVRALCLDNKLNLAQLLGEAAPPPPPDNNPFTLEDLLVSKYFHPDEQQQYNLVKRDKVQMSPAFRRALADIDKLLFSAEKHERLYALFPNFAATLLVEKLPLVPYGTGNGAEAIVLEQLPQQGALVSALVAPARHGLTSCMAMLKLALESESTTPPRLLTIGVDHENDKRVMSYNGKSTARRVTSSSDRSVEFALDAVLWQLLEHFDRKLGEHQGMLSEVRERCEHHRHCRQSLEAAYAHASSLDLPLPMLGQLLNRNGTERGRRQQPLALLERLLETFRDFKVERLHILIDCSRAEHFETYVLPLLKPNILNTQSGVTLYWTFFVAEEAVAAHVAALEASEARFYQIDWQPDLLSRLIDKRFATVMHYIKGQDNPDRQQVFNPVFYDDATFFLNNFSDFFESRLRSDGQHGGGLARHAPLTQLLNQLYRSISPRAPKKTLEQIKDLLELHASQARSWEELQYIKEQTIRTWLEPLATP